MFDTATLTISGNVVADPRISGAPDDPDRVNFRVVSNRRRRDPESGEWTDAGEYGVNVVCWRRLARGVAQSVRRGDPVLVTGRISQHDYVDSEGVRRWVNEVTADYVGHDLGKGAARFYRFTRLDRLDDAAPSTGTGDDAAPAAPGDQGTGADAFDTASTEGPFDGFGERETELTGV
jgi:single-strand DNA-binding protein